MIHVVEHLRFAFKIFEPCGSTELSLDFSHEGADIAVSALMPVVIRPCVANRPLIFFRNRALEGFESRHGGRPRLNRKSTIQQGVVEGGIFVTVRAAVLQVHLVGTGRVISCAVEGVYKIIQSLIDDWLRNAFIATAPDRDRWMVTKSLDGVAGIQKKKSRDLPLQCCNFALIPKNHSRSTCRIRRRDRRRSLPCFVQPNFG